jgi:hypothetical protein
MRGEGSIRKDGPRRVLELVYPERARIDFDPSELLFSWFACDAEGGMIYSYRSAITGSVRIARRAGT